MNKAHQSLLLLQKQIHHSLEVETASLTGQLPNSIKKYKAEFERALRQQKQTARIISAAALIATIKKHDVSFIADLHTFAQAQRTALRILRQSIKCDENWLLGLEIVPSSLQSQLDAYINGDLDLSKLNSLINFQEVWGFPWKNYVPIFEWARTNKVRIIGLNTRNLSDTLVKRDTWAAAVITEALKRQIPNKKKTRMIVLYGEWHLSSNHLPKILQKLFQRETSKKLSSISIHQNIDFLYWKLAKKRKELEVNVVKLGKKDFCIVSATPWAKLQSLANWAEGTPEDSEHDYLSHIRNYGNIIANFFNVPAVSFDSLSIKTLREANFPSKLSRRIFTANEIKLLHELVLANQRFYISKTKTAYLAVPSPNAAAEMAAIHLFRSTVEMASEFRADADCFSEVILEYAFGFLGSLIINPRRKCDLIEDHRVRLKDLERTGYKEIYRNEKKTRAVTIEIAGRQLERSHVRRVIGHVKNRTVLIVCARHLGEMTAKDLYNRILSQSIPIESVRSLFFDRVIEEDPFTVYSKIAALAGMPKAEKSKSEKF